MRPVVSDFDCLLCGTRGISYLRPADNQTEVNPNPNANPNANANPRSSPSPNPNPNPDLSRCCSGLWISCVGCWATRDVVAG